MVRNFRVVAGLAIAVAMGSGLSAKGAPLPDVNVKTTIADTGQGAVPLRIESDGGGTYQTTIVGKTKTVTSAIYSFDVGGGAIGTDFFLTTYYASKGTYVASGRTALVDLSEHVGAGAFPTPSLGIGRVPVQVGVKCRLAPSGPVNMLAMTAGSSVECPGSLRFWAPDGQWYRLSFEPENFSASDRWQVTCTASTTRNGCSSWTITPSSTLVTGTDPNPKSLNTLLKIDSSGNILAVGADYYLSFAITVER